LYTHAEQSERRHNLFGPVSACSVFSVNTAPGAGTFVCCFTMSRMERKRDWFGNRNLNFVTLSFLDPFDGARLLPTSQAMHDEILRQMRHKWSAAFPTPLRTRLCSNDYFAIIWAQWARAMNFVHSHRYYSTLQLDSDPVFLKLTRQRLVGGRRVITENALLRSLDLDLLACRR
jgi:hypothetical protein